MQLFGEAGQWFSQQPPCSKWLLLFSLLIPVGMQLGLLPVQWLYNDWRLILYSGQLWRPFTSLFFTKPSLSFLFNCFFRFQYSGQLELASGKFLGDGEYLYFLLITCLALNVPFYAYLLQTTLFYRR